MSHTTALKASHYITMHKCFTESDVSNNDHQSQHGLLSKSGFPELAHKKINSCVLHSVWHEAVFLRQKRMMIEKKRGGLTRNREDNQLGLQSNTQVFTKGQTRFSLTPCWSFVHLSIWTTSLCVCALVCVWAHCVRHGGLPNDRFAYKQLIQIHRGEVCVCFLWKQWEIVRLPSSGAEGLQFNNGGRSHYQLPVLDIACVYMHFVRSGLTRLNFSLSKERGRTRPNQPAQSQMSFFPRRCLLQVEI